MGKTGTRSCWQVRQRLYADIGDWDEELLFLRCNYLFCGTSSMRQASSHTRLAKLVLDLHIRHSSWPNKQSNVEFSLSDSLVRVGHIHRLAPAFLTKQDLHKNRRQGSPFFTRTALLVAFSKIKKLQYLASQTSVRCLMEISFDHCSNWHMSSC